MWMLLKTHRKTNWLMMKRGVRKAERMSVCSGGYRRRLARLTRLYWRLLLTLVLAYASEFSQHDINQLNFLLRRLNTLYA